MKIRSKALYQYLLEANVLHGSDDAIMRAKCEYRKQYKRNWKRQSRPRKEIRFMITVKQFATLKGKATSMNTSHTTYVRNMVLSDIDQPTIHDERLSQIFQSISMAAIALEQHKPYQYVQMLVQRAEAILLQYLNAKL